MPVNLTDIASLTVPVGYLLAAAVARMIGPKGGWRVLQGGNMLVLLVALAVPLLPAAASGLFLLEAVNQVVLGLVAFIGLVVVRFSARYLEGDPAQGRFQGWMQLTLACVALVVTTNHLVILIVAWTAISLSLGRLLMFYPDRKRAAIAAHKKFLFARVAELCLVGAAILLYREQGTLFIDALLAPYADGVAPGPAAQAAAVLIAFAALIKCAQFPMHGWLIQVVEAPTPVSALLHAGIVNLGGFLLLIMAPLMRAVELANWLLLVVAGLTCVGAALITMTRISIKVLLAWSTVAQMGLMLVECALGHYGLALLHLVAHSCYKAYSFLSAGGQVEAYLRQQLARPRQAAGAAAPLVFLGLAALVMVPATTMAGGALLSADTGLWLLFILLPVILLTEQRSVEGASALLPALGLSVLLTAGYLLQKKLFGALAPAGSHGELAQGIWMTLLVCLLLGSYWLLRHHGQAGITRRLYRNLYAGFYLDEWSTRITLAVWPARLPSHTAHRRPHPHQHPERTP